MNTHRSTAVALAGALLFAAPVFAQGTTSGPASGTPATNSMPATPHQAKTLNAAPGKTGAQTAATEGSKMDTKHVQGEKGAESGKPVVK